MRPVLGARSTRRKIATGLTAVGLVTAALVVASPTAQATVSPSAPKGASRTTFVIPAGGRAMSIKSGASTLRVMAAPNVVTSCTLTAYQPFRYLTNPSGGGEQGDADITCNQAVVSLYLEVKLYRNGVQVASNSDTNSGSSSISVYTEYPVEASGAYRTSADGDWTASDNSGILPLQYSSTAYYSCC